jgi:hypothetical protein
MYPEMEQFFMVSFYKKTDNNEKYLILVWRDVTK